MIQIDGIRETKRGRFALFSEDEFLFSIDGETLLQYNIQESSSLSEGELSSLREASDTRKAKDQALRFLARRAHGQQELYQKLCRTHDEYSAAAAVAAMAELGLLDDGQFAADLAEALVFKGKSRFEIRNSLLERGIDPETAEWTVDSLELDDAETARQLVEKKYKEKLAMGKRQAVLAALSRRGFSLRDSMAALEAAQPEQDEE